LSIACLDPVVLFWFWARGFFVLLSPFANMHIVSDILSFRTNSWRRFPYAVRICRTTLLIGLCVFAVLSIGTVDWDTLFLHMAPHSSPLGSVVRLRGAGQGGYAAVRIGEASHPGPARSGPYERGGPLDDVPSQFTVRHTFIDAGPVDAYSRRHLRRVRTEGDEQMPAAEPSSSSTRAAGSNVAGNAPNLADSGGVGGGALSSVVRGGGATSSAARWYCPVAGCPEGNPTTAAGWKNLDGMRPHLNDHSSGRCLGFIPSVFLHQHQYVQCSVCSNLLVARYGPACPRCRPSLLRAALPAASAAARAQHDSLPPLHEMAGQQTGTKEQVAKGAKRLWAQCLVQA
jgi:hypothetical protein